MLVVDCLCLGIFFGECFGLLGVNGVGKMFMFCMVMGDILVSRGEVVLVGYSVVWEFSVVYFSMGYCF